MPSQTTDSSFEQSHRLLNEYEKLSSSHYKILAMSWAGWVFDFYDLILFTFLLIPISKEYHFTDLEMSYVFGSTLAATAIGGVIFGILSD
jgi:MFS family permease